MCGIGPWTIDGGDQSRGDEVSGEVIAETNVGWEPSDKLPTLRENEQESEGGRTNERGDHRDNMECRDTRSTEKHQRSQPQRTSTHMSHTVRTRTIG